MSLEPIKQQLLDRCIRQLSAIKAEFAIVIDGEKYGTLDIVPPKKKKTLNKNRWAAVSDGIKAKISAMQIGDVVRFETPDNEPISDFQCHVSRTACFILGKGNDFYNTSQTADRKAVDVIRLQ